MMVKLEKKRNILLKIQRKKLNNVPSGFVMRWTALYPGYGVNVETKKTKNNNL